MTTITYEKQIKIKKMSSWIKMSVCTTEDLLISHLETLQKDKMLVYFV